ncbi:hypothetical protein ACFL1M_00785 [Patescibacteria group bacterium]
MTLLILRIIIAFALLFSLLQLNGLIKIKNSQVKKEWLINVLAYYLFLESLGILVGIKGVRQNIYLSLFAVPVWINLIKFSIGLIQKKEITILNRLEHTMGGLIVFTAITLLKPINILPVMISAKWFEAFLYVLITNFLSVLHEVVELFFDRVMGKKYLIGPEVDDTNFDLLMTLAGSIIGFLLVVVFKISI